MYDIVKVAITAVMLLACDHAGSSTTFPGAGDEAATGLDQAPCTSVAQHLATFMSIESPAIVRTCIDRRWALEARGCFLSARGSDACSACETKLTSDQERALDQALAPGASNQVVK